METSIALIICAAGSSSRMGGGKKEFLPLIKSKEKNLTVLGKVMESFSSFSDLSPLVITLPPAITNAEEQLPLSLRNKACYVKGGENRRASVYNALKFLKSYNISHVLIHDGARPWISTELIKSIIDEVKKCPAVIPGIALTETPKDIINEGNNYYIKKHLKRKDIFLAQTPQAFAFPDILFAHEKALEREKNENMEYTDDAEIWSEFIGRVKMIPGDIANKKITFPEDLKGA